MLWNRQGQTSAAVSKKVPVHTLYEDAQTMEPAAALTSGNGTVRNYTGTEIVAQAILTEHDTRVWSKLFTRKILQGHTFKEGLSIGEDMLFFLSLIDRNSKYSLLEKELYLYTVNPDGAMEKPFVPSHMDQLRCWELAGEMIMRHFPDLLATGDNAAKLAAVSLVSAILTASKIARLPRTVTFSADSPQNSSVSLSSAEADRLFAICREHALKYSKVPGVHQYLPQGYRQKEFLLLHMPGVYRRIYQKSVGNFR